MSYLYKIKNLLLIFIFIILLVIPLIFVGRTESPISSTENRKLADSPVLFESGSLNRDYFVSLKLWFEDNMGFRGWIVKTNKILQYKLFHVLTGDNIILGSSDWLYRLYPYKLNQQITNYQHLNLLSNADLEKYASNFEEMNDYLRLKNIPFLVMISPSKETIYPEYMPKEIYQIGSVSKTNQIIDYLVKHNIDAFTPNASLLEMKKNHIVFSQNHDIFHWNEYGAFIAYKDIMNHYKKYNTSVVEMNDKDIILKDKVNYLLLDGAIPFQESDYDIDSKKGFTSLDVTHPFISTQNYSFLTWHIVNKSDTRLPKILIFGDSFIYQFMFKFFNESFSEVYFIHWMDSGDYEKYIKELKPDVVLLTMVETTTDQYVDAVSYAK